MNSASNQRDQRSEIAAHLRSHSQEIMQRWEDSLRKNAEPPLTFTKLALRNGFPRILEKLAFYFESPDHTYSVTVKSSHHGKQRAGMETYSLAQLLYEYNFLRQTIFESLDPIFPLSAGDRNTILQAIEIELSASASAFMAARGASDQQGRFDAEVAQNQAQADVKALKEERNQSLESAEVLRQKIGSLESDKEVRERFVASLSHDLRNPIGASKMATDILLGMLPDTPEIQPFAQILIRSLDRAETMLLDLLDMTRIRAGHPIELRLAQCDLAKTVTEILDVMATSKGTRFDFFPTRPIIGFWSEDHIRRMIENLCDNAIKYGDSNKPMTVTLVQDNEQTAIKVHNFGGFIPPAKLSSLFEPFSRLQSPGSKGVGGWGIGLTFVKGVAEAHAGTVTVRSKPEEGTTFTVTLPNDCRPLQSPAAAELY